MNVREMEGAIVWYHAVNRKALAKWPTLLLSPECVACIEALNEHPDRTPSVAVALDFLIGDMDPALHPDAFALALEADDLTLAQCITMGGLDTIVHALHAVRIQFTRKAA